MSTGPGPMASILIVDDEEGLQTSLVTSFAKEGYRTAGARSGAEALELLSQEAFDILLSDLVMPGMDGLTLMEQALRRAPDLVVILMTGGGTVESAVRALKGGAYDYILKPFTLGEIFHVAGRGLERLRLRRENVQLGEINRRLQEIDELKSNLLSAVTHEFRTPLTIMHGWLDLLLGDQFGRLTGQQHESLRAVRRSAVRLGRLIDNLLAFVEYEHGRAPGKLPGVLLSDLLRDAAEELRPDCEERHVKLGLEIGTTLPALQADGERLRLLFFNLVENAVKFNEPGGEVQVLAREDAEGVEVCITNTHGEFPAEQIPRLLQPFTQRDMSMTRAAGGLGLGLAVVRAILEGHGGRLAVERSPERGTTVRVRLPVKAN
ncbi:MAG TPA: hybrid sensor histidine kinase/response regulator [Candidatus Methylomirabilis sp.]|nr:hybrid sensor histidine kinase/response regulator [Candidatus Methylomirabilis sp.]